MTRRTDSLSETLAVLDVGHGTSVVLFSGDAVSVFDTGTGSGLLEFLEQQRVSRIRAVFLSHADKDHIGGLTGLLAAKTVAVDRVILNTDSLKNSAIWDDLLYELDRRQRAGEIIFETTMTAGNRERVGAVTAIVAAPSHYLSAKGPGSTDRAGRRISSNSISAVIRLCNAAGPIALLTGDLDSVGLEELLRTGGACDAPVLVFPHHGGGTGATDVQGYVNRLVQRVQPRVVVFSIGRSRGGTPDPAVVRHLRQAAPDARIICTQLSRHCAKALLASAPSHLSPAFALGRSDHACCGGTILIPLQDPARVAPGLNDHLAFINTAAESPMCISGEAP